MANKKSFFSKLTGVGFRNEDDYEMDGDTEQTSRRTKNNNDDEYDQDYEEAELVGELSIDMYQTTEAIIIKAMVEGIKKSEIDISLTRDQVIIEGSRESKNEGTIEETYFEEIYWGSFERIIDLPTEVDIEGAEAQEEHGLLTLILPILDKKRQARISIK